MSTIHPTAIVSEKASIGENVTISPYAIIHDDVVIGDNTHIGPHTCVYDGARIGNNVTIYQSGSIAHIPQDLKFDKEPSLCIVGDNTTLHEFVTLHRGTSATGKTVIGSNVLMMAYSHVAHDCVIGNNCILANLVQIGGHVELEEYVILGGDSPVHQFCKIGKHAMVGGHFRVVQDVPPYVLVAGEPLEYSGINTIGLRRRGFTSDQITILKKVYNNYIYSKHYNVSQAKEKIKEEFGDDPLVKNVLDFLEKVTRGLVGK